MIAHDLLEEIKEVLLRGCVPQSAQAEAEQILMTLSGQTEKPLDRFSLLEGSRELSSEFVAMAKRSARRRAHGEVLQYILGRQAFLDHEYLVGPGVLVPRPETEGLVEITCQLLESPQRGIEIGLGSGAISIELLLYFPHLKIWATELEESAIQWARQNSEQLLGKDRDRLVILHNQKANSVFGSLPHLEVDFLISNPPYLSREQDEVEADVLKWEPTSALFAPEEDLLFFYKQISQEAHRFLSPRGSVFLEIPHERVDSIEACMDREGWSVQRYLDLTGRPRFLVASSKTG